jgi:glycosyltransferase involved in cell wall biosynthesis
VQIPLFSLRHGTAAGLESAVLNLIAGLTQIGTPVRLPFASAERLSPEFLIWADQQRSVAFQKYPFIKGGMWTRFIEEAIFYNRVHSDGPILFPNYFLPPTFKRHSFSSFCCIHDCQHRVFPQFFSAKKSLWLDLNFKHSLTKAARVLLISEFERNQIARFYGEPCARNCTVVYNSVDWARYTRGDASPRIKSLSEKQYILSVSHQYAHKNTVTIIDAFALLAADFPDLHLILVGRESQNVGDRIGAIDNGSVRDRIVSTGFIADADLGRLYEQCQLFVLASEYEGFGMPVVEAMGFGVPVIVTDGSSLPEVTLGKAHYVASRSSAAVWADAIGQQLRSHRDEANLQQNAALVRTRFSPETVAKAVLTCLTTY